MRIDLDSVGRVGPEVRTGWTADDACLYALAVGAGQVPGRELGWTTEDSEGAPHRVLPSYAAVISQRAVRPSAGRYLPSSVVHAEQHIALERPLGSSGSVVLTAEIEQILDKGSGALVWTRTRAVDPVTGELAFTARSAAFVRGEGGFGGVRGSAAVEPWARPEREPDVEVSLRVRPEQALLYRLTGDRNPLHYDPLFARRAGFAQPILQGLCTYGFGARAIIAALCDGDSDRLAGFGGRFTAPVAPGAELLVRAWSGTDRSIFQVLDTHGAVVIDRGVARILESD